MRRSGWLTLICVGTAVFGIPRFAFAQYETTLEIFEGSVGCRAGLKGPSAGPALSIDLTLLDPMNAVLHSESDFTYSANIRVEFEVPAPMSGLYKCQASFNVDGFSLPPLEEQKVIYIIPTGESTSSDGWHPGNPTIHGFRSTLQGGDFSGRSVREADPGGGGPDTCWYSGSPIAKQEGVPPGSPPWSVDASNSWGVDYIGWDAGGVAWYRLQGRAPCETSFQQTMYINRPGSSDASYSTKMLRMGFTDTTAWSERDFVRVERTWP